MGGWQTCGVWFTLCILTFGDCQPRFGSPDAFGGPDPKNDGRVGSILAALGKDESNELMTTVFAKTQQALIDNANGKKRLNVGFRLLTILAEKLAKPLPNHVHYQTSMDSSCGGCLASRLAFPNNIQSGFKPFGMVLHPQVVSPASLPDPDALFSTVFERKTFIPETRVPINTLLVAFVNWFHDDEFATVHHSNGSNHDREVKGLRLYQVYGTTPSREQALRLFDNGKMKTQTIYRPDGTAEELPPFWLTISADFPDFKMWTYEDGQMDSPDNHSTMADVSNASYFAFGDPRFNMHPGHIIWGTIALRVHNRVCDILLEANPSWTDEKLFQTAKVVLFHIVQKIRLQDFISDGVSHTRASVRLTYDPDILREPLSPFILDSTPNFIEFNHVYRAWHSLIPELLVEANEDPLPFIDTLWRPSLFFNNSFASMVRKFQSTPQGQYGASNTPTFLKHITIQTILDERAQGFRSFNDYREWIGMDRLTSFDQFGLDSTTTNSLAALYNFNIDAVELFVGLQVDTADRHGLKDNIFGNAQLLMVTLFALQGFYNCKTINSPTLWSKDFLSSAGQQFVREFDLGQLLANITGGLSSCPFMHNPTGCDTDPDPVGVDDWNTLDGDICAYIGIDWTDWMFDSEISHDAYSFVAISSFVIYIVYWFSFRTMKYMLRENLQSKLVDSSKGEIDRQDSKSPRGPHNEAARVNSDDYSNILTELDILDKDPSHQIYLSSLLLTSAIITSVLVIPSTIAVLQVLASKDQIGAIEHNMWFLWICLTSSTLLYTVEVALKINSRRLGLTVAHHTLYIFLVIFTVSITRSVFLLKVGSVLQCFNLWEFPIFWAFFLNRLPEHKLSSSTLQKSIACFTILYLLSRFVQFCLLVTIFSCGPRSDNAANIAEFGVTVPLVVVLMCMQIQLVGGLRYLYNRASAKAKGVNGGKARRGTTIHFTQADFYQNHEGNDVHTSDNSINAVALI